MNLFMKSLLKKKIVWIYSGIICTMLCICFLLLIVSRSVQEFDGGYVFAPENSDSHVLFENLSLKPGVYQIILNYRTDQDYSAYCNIRDDSVREKSLLTNGEHLYAGRAETTFYLWLFESTDKMQVVVDYAGGCYVETGKLLIRNTGKLWSIRAVLILLTGALGFGVLVISFYQKEYGISAKTWQNWGILAGITLAASVLQLGGYMIGGADLTYHLQRIEGVKDSLLSGQFPIRIEPEWLFGHGYANGIFYCDVLFYLPALLRIAGFTITTAYNFYCICLNFATAYIAWYCFGQIFDDDRIGLMCSALYTLSIIRIYKLMIVGAVGEGSAITFLPLVFYGIYIAFQGKTNAWRALAIGYAGLIQTHVLTCEITAFLTVLICIIGIKRIFNWKVFQILMKGALGALGLGFWYLIPFMDYYFTQDVHIRHVSARTIQERGLHLIQHFVNSWTIEAQERLAAKGLTDIDLISPGWVCLLALLMFPVALILRRKGIRKINVAVIQVTCISVLLAYLLLFMTLHVFPWDWIQERGPILATLVSSLQFPNRFMGWAIVFMVMAFGACMWLIPKKTIAYIAGTVLVVFHITTAAFGLMGQAIENDAHLYIYNEAGMGFGYISGAEYLIQGTDLEKLSFSGAVAGDHVKITEYHKRYLQIKLLCENTGDEESYIDFPLLLYKGYQAKSDTGEKLQVCYGDNYLVRVILPPGYSGGVNVRFVSPFYWRISEFVTAITVLVMVLSLTGNKKRGTLTQLLF